jgi:hypothetical protein
MMLRAPGRSGETLQAPSAQGGTAALRAPGRDGSSQPPARSFPPLDEHVVRPEAREELVRGERIEAQPALAPHGDGHFRLDYVIGGHVRPGYVGSTDLLTRVLHDADFASDTCIRAEGEDPATGERFLEEVAFEVVHQQSLHKVEERAEDWKRRGVRRVFAVFVKKGTVEEWIPEAAGFSSLDASGAISDPCLVRPLPVRALVDAAAADDEVARALEAKDNPAIRAMKAEGEELGALREAAAAVLAVLESRGIPTSAGARRIILGAGDLSQLRRWLVRAATAASADEALAG